MAVAWSKTLPYTCYELGHCWTPSCTHATLPVYWHAFKYSLKVYGTLYLLAAVLRRRKKEYFTKRLIPETIRSAFFLSTNGACFLASFCFWRKISPSYFFFNAFLCGIPTSGLVYFIERSDRHLLGHSTYITSGFVPTFIASFIAIICERKPRRPLLALYLLNLAMETAFKMAVSRGMVKSIKNGEVLLFSTVISVYTYLYKKNILQANVKRLMSFFIGPGELPVTGTGPGTLSSSTDTQDSPDKSSTLAGSSKPTSEGIVSYFPKELKTLIAVWRQGSKHKLCRHKFSCLANSVESGVKLFVIGYVVQAAMKLVRALTMVFRKPRALLEALKHRDNLHLGLFLGSFSALLKVSHCLLRWIRNKDSPIHGFFSGFVAGWSMMWYKSSSVAMWLTSKLAEILYMKGIDTGVLPYIKYGDVIVYTFSTAFVLHAAVFEPHNIRPAYWKFLLGLTDNKFSLMNRRLLDEFGTNSSKMYPHYWPDYDSRFTPNL